MRELVRAEGWDVYHDPALLKGLYEASAYQAGEIRLTQGNFGNQIVDFADRAMCLRCCNQREAWLLTMPAVAMAGALSPALCPGVAVV